MPGGRMGGGPAWVRRGGPHGRRRSGGRGGSVRRRGRARRPRSCPALGGPDLRGCPPVSREVTGARRCCRMRIRKVSVRLRRGLLPSCCRPCCRCPCCRRPGRPRCPRRRAARRRPGRRRSRRSPRPSRPRCPSRPGRPRRPPCRLSPAVPVIPVVPSSAAPPSGPPPYPLGPWPRSPCRSERHPGTCPGRSGDADCRWRHLRAHRDRGQHHRKRHQTDHWMPPHSRRAHRQQKAEETTDPASHPGAIPASRERQKAQHTPYVYWA